MTVARARGSASSLSWTANSRFAGSSSSKYLNRPSMWLVFELRLRRQPVEADLELHLVFVELPIELGIRIAGLESTRV
jgi:hypothetical protein